MRTYQVGERDAQGKVVFDPEKAADVPATEMFVRGVRLESRYGHGAEYRSMSRVVEALPENLVRRLRQIWCDSKACAVYGVEGDLTQRDLDLIGLGFVHFDGGHNGVYGPDDLYVEADWAVDDQVLLLRAAPHQWGTGKVHLINTDDDSTLCGQSPARCPGEKFYGAQDLITCVKCQRSLEARAAAEERRAAAEKARLAWAERQADREQRRRPMTQIRCSVEETELEGDRGLVPSVVATCSRCDHQTESFGTSEASIKRCLVLLREGCPMGERNFYVDENDT